MLKTRQPGAAKAAADDAGAAGTDDGGEPDNNRLPLILSRKRLQKRSPHDSIMPLGAKPGGKPDAPKPSEPTEVLDVDTVPDGSAADGKPSRRHKPPRLIQ
jgi:hypothetical protein